MAVWDTGVRVYDAGGACVHEESGRQFDEFCVMHWCGDDRFQLHNLFVTHDLVWVVLLMDAGDVELVCCLPCTHGVCAIYAYGAAGGRTGSFICRWTRICMSRQMCLSFAVSSR